MVLLAKGAFALSSSAYSVQGADALAQEVSEFRLIHHSAVVRVQCMPAAFPIARPSLPSRPHRFGCPAF